MLTFKHGGDIGDIIYSLPIIRYFDGGERKCTLLIEAVPWTRVHLTPDKWSGIDLLIRQQPYIKDVMPLGRGQHVNYNLNDFRVALHRSMQMKVGMEKHLAHWMMDTHGVPHSEMDKAWLQVEDPVKAAKVVISRSAGRDIRYTYHNPRFPWHAIREKYHDKAVFVGTETEHELFCIAHGKIAHHKTENLFEAARVIAGCDLFIGNQSAPHAIAEAMKKNIVLEVWPQGPNCLVFRRGVIHGWDQNVTLPDV